MKMKRESQISGREGRLTRIIPAFELNVDEAVGLMPFALPLVSCPPGMNSYSSS